MRVLVITNLFPSPLWPLRGSFNQHQFRALAGHHAVSVICPIAWTDEIRASRSKRAALARTRAEVITASPDDFGAENMISVTHPRFLFPPKLLRETYGPLLRRSIRPAFAHALNTFKPDIILGSWAYPDGWAAVHLAHEAGLPALVKVHGSDILHLADAAGRRRRTCETMQRADAIIAVNPKLAARASDLGAKRVDVIPNGIDSNLFQPGSREQARDNLQLSGEIPIILFVGNLVAVKGVDLLIRACANLANSSIPFNCHLIGHGPTRSRLERLAIDLNLRDRIIFHGSLPQAQLPEWYRAADVVALPSYSEGTPNVLLEALASGTRFVASNVGGIPEIAAMGASRLFPVGDISALSKGLGEMLTGANPAPITAPSLPTHEKSAAKLADALQDILLKHRRSKTPAARIDSPGADFSTGELSAATHDA